MYYSNINMVIIDKSWEFVLWEEFKKSYFFDIKKYLLEQKNLWKTIYPGWKNILNAFYSTPFDKVKVVIIWQDPYHCQWQAHWLCFSVPEGIKSPPSLKNIYKELNRDIGFEIPNHGCLQKWTEQWVFLLNSVLTVEHHKPASHSKIWRNIFTDQVIKILSDKKEWLVFLLRWSFAQSKKVHIDIGRHCVLETSHPSPFSVYRWFLWCGHFSKTNSYLKKIWKSIIDWSV